MHLDNRTPLHLRKENTSKILHPTVRYIQKLGMFSIFGRTELGNNIVREKDMKLLDLLIIDKKTPTPINFTKALVCLKREKRPKNSDWWRDHLVATKFVLEILDEKEYVDSETFLNIPLLTL